MKRNSDRNVCERRSLDRAESDAPSQSSPSAVADYHVHAFVVVRIPVNVEGALSAEDAASKALALIDFDRDVRCAEFADTVVGVSIDAFGDEEEDRTIHLVPGGNHRGGWVRVAGAAAPGAHTPLPREMGCSIEELRSTPRAAS
ncbi:hypothetical protein QZM25_28245 [Burkholderia contaminans]|uniref:hypothetical protein n=1 Tax=Burkholderia cepacia complex TaxID=87882 RepID=UPI001CF3EBA7|nr:MULTISPECIES: hypothetical protein [Burkholderia cepacia complex]MCA7889756.1 hypothetical protein [Burkholderia contaminans]MDN7576508.1 hypothetical protein [Burkholderia contaminans]MDN7670658.1 hypothetical protein [Burkholderia vietnamiensis]